MKKNIIALQLALVLFVVQFMVSCKKEPVNNAQCRIVTLSIARNNANFTCNITYDNTGRPTMINFSNGANSSTRTITYDGNTVISIVQGATGAFIERDSVTLDNKKLITNMRLFFNASGTDWDNTQIIYANDGTPLKEINTTAQNSSPWTTTYTVSNGDIVAATSGTGTEIYEYYTDKPYQSGDFFAISSILNYGVEGYRRSAHLFKSFSFSPTQIIYNFNENGFITRLQTNNTTNPSASFAYSYQYDCY